MLFINRQTALELRRGTERVRIEAWGVDGLRVRADRHRPAHTPVLHFRLMEPCVSVE